jgi:type IV secretion system protein VirD4
MFEAIEAFKAWNSRALDCIKGFFLTLAGGLAIIASVVAGVWLAYKVLHSWYWLFPHWFALAPVLAGAAGGLGGYILIARGLPRFLPRYSTAAGKSRWGAEHDLKSHDLVDEKDDFYSRMRDDWVYCGFFRNRPVFYPVSTQITTFGPSGCGKGTGYLIPNLKRLNRSMVVFDPKGELAAVTARWRERFGRVLIFNPCGTLTKDGINEEGVWSEGLKHLESVGFNALLGFTPDDDDFYERCAEIAEDLIPLNPKDPFWTESARALVVVAIMRVKWMEHKRQIPAATFDLIMELISTPYTNRKGKDSLKEILHEINEHGDEGMARAAGRFLKGDNDNGPQIGDVISTTLTALQSFHSKQIRADTAKHPTLWDPIQKKEVPFDWDMLKRQVVTVYVIMPWKKLETHAAWLRLVIGSALNRLTETPPGPINPLFMLDEVSAIGRLTALEKAMDAARGNGITIWTIWQHVDQIKKTYGEFGPGVFTSGVGFLNTFRITDPDTQDFWCRMLGTRTVVERSYNAAPGGGMHTYSETESAHGHNLMNPGDFRMIATEKTIGFVGDCGAPFKLDVPGYFRFCAKGLDPNPFRPPEKKKRK